MKSTNFDIDFYDKNTAKINDGLFCMAAAICKIIQVHQNPFAFYCWFIGKIIQAELNLFSSPNN